MLLCNYLLVLTVLVVALVAASPDDESTSSYIYYLEPKYRHDNDVTNTINSAIGNEHYSYESRSVNLGTFFWWVEFGDQAAQKFEEEHQPKFMAMHKLENLKAVPRSVEVNPNTGDDSEEEEEEENDAEFFKTRDELQDDFDDFFDDNEPDLEARDGAKHLSYQSCPPDDLKLVSQPENVPWDGLPSFYYYYKSLGKGTTIYVLDTGADLRNPEFAHIRDSTRWIWAGPNPAEGDKFDGDREYHGTGVLSKLVGKTMGVARNANVVLIRLDDKNGMRFNEHLVDGFLKAYDDIIRINAGQEKVNNVINLSTGFAKSNDDMYNEAIKTVSTDIMKALTDLDNVFPVVAAGKKRNRLVDWYPALNGKDFRGRLVVAGGVDQNFQNFYQTAPWVKVSALAVGVKAAMHGENARGMSFSTPVISGVVSYLLGEGYDPKTLIQEVLYKHAHPRARNGPPVVWNLADFRKDDLAPKT